MPASLAMVGLVVLLTLVAVWGIKESAVLITLITLLEIGGLAFVLLVGVISPHRLVQFHC